MPTIQVGPGIQSIPSGQIPKQWSSTWFVQFIQNWLAAADIRNATGNGITISGNGTTPATLSTKGYSGSVVISGTTLTFQNGLLIGVTS